MRERQRGRFDVLQPCHEVVNVVAERRHARTLRAEILAIWARWNEADNGRLVLPQEYLLSVIRL
jgi:hypothetical protein